MFLIKCRFLKKKEKKNIKMSLRLNLSKFSWLSGLGLTCVSLGLQWIIQTVIPMDWYNKLQERSLSMGDLTLYPFYISWICMWKSRKRDKNMHDFDFWYVSSSVLPTKEGQRESLWFCLDNRGILFYIICHFHTSVQSLITITILYSLIHYLLERLLYYTFCFLPL